MLSIWPWEIREESTPVWKSVDIQRIQYMFTHKINVKMSVDPELFDSSGGLIGYRTPPRRNESRFNSCSILVDGADYSLRGERTNLPSKMSVPVTAKTKTEQNDISKRLGINIVSIIIGALFFVIVFTWVEVMRVICKNITKDEPDPELEKEAQKKWWMGLITTLLALFFIILLYTWFTRRRD